MGEVINEISILVSKMLYIELILFSELKLKLKKEGKISLSI